LRRDRFPTETAYAVIIKTPISHWKFDYHTPLKTLWHGSTYKINLETGNPAFHHKQFESRKISWQEVIDIFILMIGGGGKIKPINEVKIRSRSPSEIKSQKNRVKI
jgi:hypothetical protein